MARKRFTVEQIIYHLREADVLLAQELTVGEVCRRIGVSDFGGYSKPSYRRIVEVIG